MMKESHFLVIMAHLQIILAMMSSGGMFVLFLILASINSVACMYQMYQMYKEGKEQETGSISVATIVFEKEKV